MSKLSQQSEENKELFKKLIGNGNWEDAFLIAFTLGEMEQLRKDIENIKPL